jgi:hypothetical protein
MLLSENEYCLLEILVARPPGDGFVYQKLRRDVAGGPTPSRMIRCRRWPYGRQMWVAGFHPYQAPTTIKAVRTMAARQAILAGAADQWGVFIRCLPSGLLEANIIQPVRVKL